MYRWIVIELFHNTVSILQYVELLLISATKLIKMQKPIQIQKLIQLCYSNDLDSGLTDSIYLQSIQLF